MRPQPAQRLDGWKSIAAYLKRDRTTVIRWYRERGLPVHRLPGGRTGTVFALKHELDLWLGMPAVSAEQAPAPLPIDEPALVAARAERRQQHAAPRWIIGLMAVGLAIGVPAALANQRTAAGAHSTPVAPPAPALALPADPETAADFAIAHQCLANIALAEEDRAG